MKTLYLDYRGSPVTISDEAYAHILSTIEWGRVCERCAIPYTEGHPCVAQNCCLPCYIQMHAVKQFQLIRYPQEEEGGEKRFAFLDANGFVSFSHPESEADRVERSAYHTILQWNYPVPTPTSGNETLNASAWHIYGNFRGNSAIVIEFSERYEKEFAIAYLAYKNGTLIELNRRKAPIRALMKQAKDRLEKTRDEQGTYHLPNGRTRLQPTLVDIYEVIAEIASEALPEEKS